MKHIIAIAICLFGMAAAADSCTDNQLATGCRDESNKHGAPICVCSRWNNSEIADQDMLILTAMGRRPVKDELLPYSCTDTQLEFGCIDTTNKHGAPAC